MIEATSGDATTIAGFLRKVTDKEMGAAPIIVVDEASMLDLMTFYRLVQKLWAVRRWTSHTDVRHSLCA